MQTPQMNVHGAVMTLTFRPLMILAAASATLFVGPVDAKKMASAPPPPAACSDFFFFFNTPWLRSHPLPPGNSSRSLWDEMHETGIRQRDSLFTSPLQNAGPAQNKLNALMQSAEESRILADSGKLLAPNTTTGPRGIIILRISGLGAGVLSGNAGSIVAVFHPPEIASVANILNCAHVLLRSTITRASG